MSVVKHTEIGKLGETKALEYLQQKGYEIIDKNYRTRYSEIDIIAKDHDFLVFVEVRSKSNEDFGRPEETIDHNKIKKINKNAEYYIANQNYDGRARIDAICIVFNDFGELERLSHYDNITG